MDFDESQLLRASDSIRFNNLRIAVLSGIMTPNEARRTEGLPDMEGGDELMFPVNTAALGSDMSGTSADGAGRPADGTLPDGGNGKISDPKSLGVLYEFPAVIIVTGKQIGRAHV